MSANMKDVALRCGVSIKTVSNVINHLPNVGEKTRQTVLEAIRELNYVPNIQARSLVMKQPAAKSQLGYRIGCIFPNGTGKYDNSYFTMILKGIEEEIISQGQQLSFISPAAESVPQSISIEDVPVGKLSGCFWKYDSAAFTIIVSISSYVYDLFIKLNTIIINNTTTTIPPIITKANLVI